MADFSIDDLWWLKTPPPRDRAPAMAAGAQIVARRAEEMRQAEQFKTSAAMRMMDMMLERERNDIALQTFKTKQATDLMRAKGMAEIGDYMANAVAREKLTDPETQAGFFRLTSKYAPFVPETVFNSMWDNSFKPAMDRKARAEGKTVDAPASIDEFNFREQLREKYSNEKDPVLKEQRLDDLKRFELKAGFTKGDPLAIEEVVGSDGTVHEFVRSPGQRPTLLKPIDDSKLTPLERMAAQAEFKALQQEWMDFSPRMKGTDGKMDPEKYKAFREEIFNRYNTDTGPTKKFIYDPTTGTAKPAR